MSATIDTCPLGRHEDMDPTRPMTAQCDRLRTAFR
jgi:hypothetical protein